MLAILQYPFSVSFKLRTWMETNATEDRYCKAVSNISTDTSNIGIYNIIMLCFMVTIDMLVTTDNGFNKHNNDNR